MKNAVSGQQAENRGAVRSAIVELSPVPPGVTKGRLSESGVRVAVDPLAPSSKAVPVGQATVSLGSLENVVSNLSFTPPRGISPRDATMVGNAPEFVADLTDAAEELSSVVAPPLPRDFLQPSAPTEPLDIGKDVLLRMDAPQPSVRQSGISEKPLGKSVSLFSPDSWQQYWKVALGFVVMACWAALFFRWFFKE